MFTHNQSASFHGGTYEYSCIATARNLTGSRAVVDVCTAVKIARHKQTINMAAKRPKGNIMNYFVHANKKAKQGEYKMLQTVYYDRQIPSIFPVVCVRKYERFKRSVDLLCDLRLSTHVLGTIS